MNKLTIYFSTLTLLTIHISCNREHSSEKTKILIDNVKAERAHPADAIHGDFNGDGKLDYAWLMTSTTCVDCEGKCECTIRFSDSGIPDILVENCNGGYPKNQSDLNENGTDEIALLPGWCTSCWRQFSVYTLINNHWQYAVKPFSTHCQQWDSGIMPIEKDISKKGFVVIRYSEFNELAHKIITKSSSILISK